MKRILKQTFIFTIIIGVFGVAVLTMTGGLSISIVHQKTLQIGSYNWTYYEIDMQKYLINLKNSLNIERYQNIIPSLPSTPNTPNNQWDAIGWLKYVAYCILTGLNYIIYAINILLCPIKIISYPLLIIYTLIGLDTTSVESINALNFLNTLFIPYIPITW